MKTDVIKAYDRLSRLSVRECQKALDDLQSRRDAKGITHAEYQTIAALKMVLKQRAVEKLA